MQRLRVWLLGLLTVLVSQGICLAASQGSQTVTGVSISEAAEKFVRRELSITEDVRGVYTVPDKILPAGQVALQPHWAEGTIPPKEGFHGRLLVPVRILVGGQLLQQVGVTIQVGPGLTENKRVQVGDLLTVILENGALRIEMQGRAQQAGVPGERIRVGVGQPQRSLLTRIVSSHEVVVETDR